MLGKTTVVMPTVTTNTVGYFSPTDISQGYRSYCVLLSTTNVPLGMYASYSEWTEILGWILPHKFSEQCRLLVAWFSYWSSVKALQGDYE